MRCWLGVLALLWGIVGHAEPMSGAQPGKRAKPSTPLMRGREIFVTYCVLCHGAKGEGNGRAAKLFNPPPANLVTSDKDSEYKRLIVTQGGKAVGRSSDMRAWSEVLTPQQIDDVVHYIDRLVVRSSALPTH